MLAVLAFLGGLSPFLTRETGVGKAARAARTRQGASIPFAVVENRGQWNSPARFGAAWGGVVVMFHQDGVEFRNRAESGSAPVRMTFEGGSSAAGPEGVGRQACVRHFLRGDVSRHRSDVPGYDAVLYRDVWPGIDLSFYETDGGIEYDILAAPGAPLDAARVRFQGAGAIAVSDSGELFLAGAPWLVQKPPVTWQVGPDGAKEPLACRPVPAGPELIGFTVPGRDPALACVVDPRLVGSTYTGGSGFDEISAVRIIGGNVAVTGRTTSPDLPGIAPRPVDAGVPPFDPSFNGDPAFDTDAFVAVLDGQTDRFLFVTYLGGEKSEYANALAGDSRGNIHVVGHTLSYDFPTTADAFQRGLNAPVLSGFNVGTTSATDAFWVQLSADGSRLLYGSFHGGTRFDSFSCIAIRADVVAIGGFTASRDIYWHRGLQIDRLGGTDGYVLEAYVDATGSGPPFITYATSYGGSGDDYVDGIALVPSAVDDLVVSGHTLSDDLPQRGGYQPASGGMLDSFLAKLSPGRAEPVYATYLGGSRHELHTSLAIDDEGAAVVGGSTSSTDFPVSANPFQASQASRSGFYDGFVARLDLTPGPPGQGLRYSSYIGGAYTDVVRDITLDKGRVNVVGYTSSHDFPTTPGAYQGQYSGDSSDAFVVAISPTDQGAGDLLYGTYFGRTSDDFAWSLATDENLSVVFAGLVGFGTGGQDGIPLTPLAPDRTRQDREGFVTRLRTARNEAATAFVVQEGVRTEGDLSSLAERDHAWLTVEMAPVTGSFHRSRTVVGAFIPQAPPSELYVAFSVKAEGTVDSYTTLSLRNRQTGAWDFIQSFSTAVGASPELSAQVPNPSVYVGSDGLLEARLTHQGNAAGSATPRSRIDLADFWWR